MKNVLMIMVILFAGLTASAQFTGATIQATGLTCAMCNNAINKALQTVPFVATVKPDISNASFFVSFKEGVDADIDIDALKKAVEDAGFSIGKMQLTARFSGEQVTDGKHIRLGNQHFHFLDVKEQTLEGERTMTVLDRDYLTAKQFRKISTSHHRQCVTSGRAADCCKADGVPDNARVYHVTI